MRGPRRSTRLTSLMTHRRSIGLPVGLLFLGLMTGACGSAEAGSEAPKETIPLAEAETDRREALGGAQQQFNACLNDAGYEFRGFAGDEGDAAVIEDPDYQEALSRCSSESGIGRDRRPRPTIRPPILGCRPTRKPAGTGMYERTASPSPAGRLIVRRRASDRPSAHGPSADRQEPVGVPAGEAGHVGLQM